MKLVRTRPFIQGFAVMLTALLFAAGATSPAAAFSFGKKHQEPVAAAPPPEPEIPVGPPVLASYVIDTASAYATYMQSASGIASKFVDGPSVLSALRLGAHSEQHQMQQGMVAYAAIVALQDPTFVAAVRGFASHASTRDAMVRYILADPNYVTTLGGHDSAAGLIIATLNSQGAQLQAAGEAVSKESLYIQLKAAWSKKPATDQPGTLLAVKQLSASTISADPNTRNQLAQASTGAQAMTLAQGAAQPPYSQAVVRGMAIAALAILGKAGDDNLDYLHPLLVNDGDGFCFNMTKLNLYQCLSVARPYYEDMYCLGLHAMADTGRCVMSSVGPPGPVRDNAGPLIATAMPAGAVATSTGPGTDLPSPSLRP